MSERTDKEPDLDAVTGLPGRSFFVKEGQKLLSDNSKEGLAVVFLDLDNFKVYNSAYSVHAGDILLRYTGKTIQNAFPEQLVARFGDDHFYVLTREDLVKDGVKTIYERLHNYDSDIRVEIKAGICRAGNHNEIVQLCDKAKIACGKIKHTYDTYISYYDDSLGRTISEQKYIVDHLGTAIRNGEIEAWFQPVIRIMSGKLCGVEALARWRDPVRGLMPPAQFIETLEKAHLIHLMDLEITRQAVSVLSDLMAEGKTVVPVSINLSRLDFQLCDIVSKVNHIVDEKQVPHDLIDIEITERALSSDDGTLKQAMSRFRSLGYRIWMDDFGSEYSSLNALKEYDFDTLKIDMKFLSSEKNGRDPKSEIIITSVINMAKEMGIQTLCEGVETEENLKFLHDAGCEKAQGFLYHKPAPAKEILAWIPEEPETREESQFMDKTGQVNLLSSFGSLKDGGGIPSAVFICDRNSSHCVSCNESFRDFLKTIGVHDMDEMHRLMNDRNTVYYRRFRTAAFQSMREGSDSSVELVLNSCYCSFHIRGIAKNQKTEEFSVRVQAVNLSEMTDFRNVSYNEAVLRNLYSVFSRVDVLELEKDQIHTVYRDNGRYVGSFENEKIREGLQTYAVLNVHPDDRERFLRAYDPDHIVERIRGGGKNYSFVFVRCRNESGRWQWQIYAQILALIKGSEMVLSVVMDGDAKVARLGEMAAEELARDEKKVSIPAAVMRKAQDLSDTRLKPEVLLRNLLDMAQVGFFWKDRERRFLGANRYFREYYGFRKDADFIGKTDEEMGWHVNPDPFRNDEYRVIQYGEIVRNAPGTCISHGQVRKIRAFKAPIYEGTKITGLVGYFIDVTDALAENPDAADRYVDALTGLMDGRGFHMTFDRYVDSYEKKGTDFFILCLDIQDFRQINVRYGFEKADKVLVLIAECMNRIAGTDSSLARVGAGRFILLRQFAGKEEISGIRTRIAVAVSEKCKDTVPDLDMSFDTYVWSEVPEEERRSFAADIMKGKHLS